MTDRLTWLDDSDLATAFRLGRSTERGLVAAVAPHWTPEHWACHMVDLQHRIASVRDEHPGARSYLFGRLSIATDKAEGRSVT